MMINFTFKNFLNFCALFVVIAFIFSTRSYPYADDWSYAASVNFSGLEFWKWVFTQHVDHFIPIQKIIHHCLAKWSGFDFRVLILLNAVFAYIAAAAAMGIAKIYRKDSAWSDLWLVPCILMPSSAYFLWAFQFQFLSSITFFLVAIYFLLCFHIREKQFHLSLGFVFLMLTVASGMNGLVLALVSTITASIYFCIFKRVNISINRLNKFLYLLLCFEFLAVILSWSASGASAVESSLLEKLKIYFYLHAAPFQISAFRSTLFYALFVILCSIASIFLLVRKFIKSRLDFSDVVLLASLFASELLLLVVAHGRSGAQGGWSNVLIIHYGPLSLITLILSWIVISAHVGRRIRVLIGLLLVGLMMLSYYKAFDWRKQHASNVITKQVEVEKSLTEIFDLSKLVNKYALELTWKDSAEAKSQVEHALNEILLRDYPRYRRANPFIMLDVKVDYLSAGIIDQSSLLSNSGFNGSDFYRTAVGGLIVYGSYVSSDADVGSILLKLRRGDRILYRSGPTFGNQLLKIEGGDQIITKLPVTTEWRVMEFSNKNLPDDFVVKLIDNGRGWGEWSSIALLLN